MALWCHRVGYNVTSLRYDIVLRCDVTSLRYDIALRCDVTSLRYDIALRCDVTSLRYDIALRCDVTSLHYDIITLPCDVELFHYDINRFLCWRYEKVSSARCLRTEVSGLPGARIQVVTSASEAGLRYTEQHRGGTSVVENVSIHSSPLINISYKQYQYVFV